MSTSPDQQKSLADRVRTMLRRSGFAVQGLDLGTDASLATALELTFAKIAALLADQPAEVRVPAFPVKRTTEDVRKDALELATDLEELVDLTVWQGDCTARASAMLRELVDETAPAAGAVAAPKQPA